MKATRRAGPWVPITHKAEPTPTIQIAAIGDIRQGDFHLDNKINDDDTDRVRVKRCLTGNDHIWEPAPQGLPRKRRKSYGRKTPK